MTVSLWTADPSRLTGTWTCLTGGGFLGWTVVIIRGG
jgi:hypothetical protein